jgi:hypothetical protein
MVTRAEVGRFLGQDDAEVQLAIDMEKLPHTTVPGRTRPGIRIFLPDFHDWLKKRSRVSPRLENYEEFRRAFQAAQPGRKAKLESSILQSSNS